MKIDIKSINLKSIVDTAAVMVGNLLNLRPTGWERSKEQAAEMRKAALEPVDDKIEIFVGEGQGEAVPVTKAQGPIEYFLNSAFNVISFAVFVYLLTFLFKMLASMLVGLLVIGVIFFVADYINKKFFPSKEDVPAPVATAA